MLAFGVLLALSALAAYVRLPREPATTVSTTPWTLRAPLKTNTSGFPARLVAVGDLHGDLRGAVNVLKLAGLVEEKTGAPDGLVDFDDWNEREAGRVGNLTWIGGRSVLVQTGDVVDRGPDTIALYALLRHLRAQAASAGGAVIPLLGNHEIMNLSGDLRYVTAGDVATFGGFANREAAFRASGPLGRYLRELDMITVVGDTVFCHGGLLPTWLAKGSVSDINRAVRGAMREGRWGDGIFSESGPVWFRGFALGSEESACPVLETTLGLLNASRMVVGHTVQHSGNILSRCGNRLFVIDVGISAAYGSNRAALEIRHRFERGQPGAPGHVLHTKVTGIYPNGRVVRFDDKTAPVVG